MKFVLYISALLGFLLVCGCEQKVSAERAPTGNPAEIRIALPAKLGKADRPAVIFDHRRHTKALEQEGCATCHSVNSKKQLLPRLKITSEPSDSAGWMKSHHKVCRGCHEERRKAGKPTGPNDCGECHTKREAPWRDVGRKLRFNYSLHYRHTRAFNDKCDACHHAYDEKQKTLAYKKGAEDACAACHQPVAEKGKTSLGDAVHTACVNCHIERQGKGAPSGPQECAGCHGAEVQAKIEKVKTATRPDRGQPQAIWIASKGTTYKSAPFDHRSHEGRASSCVDCHHKAIGRCDDCHTLLPQKKGGWVSLKQAFHTSDSTRSCVGCHQKVAKQGTCAGCHKMLTPPPNQAACDQCHSGPPHDKVDWKSSPLTNLAPRELAALPAFSTDFPEQLQLGILAKRYQPARFPHGKIVAALDRSVRESRLARRFHKETETLCAGCHHHTPTGEPVAACRSCHNDHTNPLKDMPGLNAAYHRQCIGCHQAIGHKAQGCTDCHEEAHQ
jgi:hypothetical protein